MNIIYCSDFNIIGSGYKNISIPLCEGLTKLGHNIIVCGLEYHGEEHWYPFSILSCRTFTDIVAMIADLKRLWKPDVIISAMDIPWHELVLKHVIKDPLKIPYIGIFPIESDPLCLDWAMILLMMQGRFAISDFGAKECQKLDVPTEHLQIGVDVESWRLPTKEEQVYIREALGFGDAYVILTVADNHERKNLGRAFQVISKFKKKYGKPIIYALVTRENSAIGFRLRTLASRDDIKIADSLRIFERGLNFKELWSLYAVADCFFLPSRAEGLGMPVLESFAMGVPVVATDCGGVSELVQDGRGFPIKPKFTYPDVFGDANRYMVEINDCVAELMRVATKQEEVEIAVIKAKEYVDKRTWDIPVTQLDEMIRRVVNEQKKSETPSLLPTASK